MTQDRAEEVGIRMDGGGETESHCVFALTY